MRKSTVCTIVACLLLAAMPYSVSADATEDIPTNAEATGVHDSLVAALSHADLVATLQGEGPFTVFAPTDQAFADAGIDLDTFDTPEENATLVDILLYHVTAVTSPHQRSQTDSLSKWKMGIRSHFLSPMELLKSEKPLLPQPMSTQATELSMLSTRF